MNEQIEDLAVKSGFQPYITTHEEDVAMFKKFAELVIEEAAKAHLCDTAGVRGKY